MKQTYIYRITDKRDDSTAPVRYIYAVNKESAKRWQKENCPEIKPSFECIGMKKVPIDVHAQEFSFEEYWAMEKHLSDMTNPQTWKRFMNSQ